MNNELQQPGVGDTTENHMQAGDWAAATAEALKEREEDREKS